MNDNPQLLLYIAAKIARIDAVSSSIHAMLFVDLAPEDKKRAAVRRELIQGLYDSNIKAELNHLRTQFPDDCKTISEYIELGEREAIDQAGIWLRDTLEGKSSDDDE